MLKKFILITFISILFPLFGIAQYANDWINFNQSYYRIPVAKDGIYRLTYSDLQSAGFPVSSVDPRFIQLFHRGLEQGITVLGQADAQFDPGDYLEFYGQRNDGTRDALLYQTTVLQPHSYYNLFSDTTSYFLTWSSVPPAGKRMNSFSENNIGIVKEAAHNDQELSVYVNEYSGGNTISNGEIQSTIFDEGEGWTDSYICTLNSGCLGLKDYGLDNIANGVPTAGNPRLELLIVGRDELNHQTQVYAGPNSGSLRFISTQHFVNFQTQLVTADLNWTDIGADGKMTVQVKALGEAGIRDKVSVSYIKVTFPQDFNLAGQTEKWLRLNPNPSGKSYIEINNPGTAVRVWDITDLNTASTIGTNSSSGILSAVVDNTFSSRTLYVSNEINTPAVHPVSFQQMDPSSVDYLIVTHGSLFAAAQTYASYRASVTGGGFRPLPVTMDQLYNQFNYGETSPLAIYQFVKWMVEKGSPKYLFLIGKGRDVSAAYERHPTGFKDLVPSAGLPASDMVFSAGLLGSGFAPALPTGRLSVSTPAQVIAYLNKVQETEAAPLNDLWRKKGLHLSGGIQVTPFNELAEFRKYMDGFKTIAEGPYWGGTIATIAKHDASAVQLINIADEVNAGVNLITFFGHSSPNTIDIDIGKATDPTLGYNNPGKYPVFLINGCNAGNFFSDGVSFGEDWMLAAGRGARGFIAHSSFGLSGTLQAYSDLFYRVGFGDSTFITRGIGDVQKEVARQYLLQYGSDMVNLTQAQQMMLLGDPAIKLFGTATPDYATDDASVTLHSLDGKPVTARSDSFAIDVIVKNPGAAKIGSLPVRITRTFNDNSTVSYDSVFSAPLYQDTLVFKLRKGKVNGYGNTKFAVVLDPDNTIKELDESNNTGTLNKLIPLGGTMNLLPFPYAIVNKPSVDLILQSTDLLSGQRGFQIEIDTIGTFTSPYRTHALISGKVLAHLGVNLLPTDSMVYYWRTKLDQPKPEESTDWVVSSFTFINNSPEGWGQKQFAQLFENDFSGLVRDAGSQRLKFIETSTSLDVKTFGVNNPALNTDVSVKINNAEYNLATQGQPCRANTINIVAFNKTSLVPYAGLPFSFQDVRTCGREPQVINSFTLAEMETGSGGDFPALVDAIHASDSVLVFSIGDAGYTSWSAGLKAKLRELGILEAQIAGLQNGDPVVMLGRKGAAAGTAKIFTATNAPANTQVLQVAENITGRYTSGTMTSGLIGPALRWKKIIPQATMVQTSDQYRFAYYGVKENGSQDLLQDTISGPVDLTALDPQLYPYLKLELYSKDTINLDPVQVNKWLVLYDPAPEGVLLFKGSPVQESVAEGQSWSSPYQFVNISDKTFTDSLTVNLEVLNNAKLSRDIKNFKIVAPLPGDTTQFSIMTDTRGKSGPNNITVFVNPRILPEQFYENNVADFENYLLVKADSLGPVLDVTIDGRYLANGDFVSPDPIILIKVKDENPFFFKTDTTGMSVILTYPCPIPDCLPQQIYFRRNDIQWFPATATSDFRIEFKPQNLAEGEYALFVQAADASGNKSGQEPYRVTFQVKNETSLTFQSVFPNPSSHEFFFRFDLTGNVLPDEFSLRFYAADGRPLQQFDLDATNDFHIGTNQLIWEPKDTNGNLLPGGMYLYQVRFGVGGKAYAQTGKLIVMR